eukprot:TRINITY_DN567_c0_g1_i2.p1 TRINITY_DN567_c0_g1~~TRINITY_DN567_c0_g1_i2.p1  ORF type:complete len:326 (-),score=47.53 TRINITY_DN567_c0_g1_i2:852-1829(-)
MALTTTTWLTLCTVRPLAPPPRGFSNESLVNLLQIPYEGIMSSSKLGCSSLRQGFGTSNHKCLSHLCQRRGGRKNSVQVSCSENRGWERTVARLAKRIARANSQRAPWLPRFELGSENGILTSSRAMEAMKQIDRADYVVDRQGAYEDRPQPLGFSATISAPHMHGYCLSLLEEHLQPGMKVLDVGSGSGYLTAVMALMVGESGRAIGVEHIPELVERAKRSVQQGPAAHLMEKGQLSFHATDGRLGYPEEAPFDAIHVGAAAPDLPQKLVEQLKVGGRLVCPVGTYSQELEIVDKRAGGAILRRSAMSVQYVPLTDRKEHAAVL